MISFSRVDCLFVLSQLVSLVTAACYYQSPAFPPPEYRKPCPELLEAFGQIEASLSTLMVDPALNTSSYSIEVTSSRSTLWSRFHTARDKDSERPGADQVDGRSAYRIASITKTFTVLGLLQQHAAGNLSLDDTIDTYISSLKRPQTGTIPWKDVTLRSLASQLSGIPRDWAQGDLLTEFPDPSQIGLPPVPSSGLPECGPFNNYVPCTAEELLQNLRTKPPLFAPNQKSTYSNIAYELLGLVLTNVTGMSYEDYIDTAILKPLNMTGTSFSKPADSVAVLPKNHHWYWDVDEGVQNPTGGLYASSSDMSKFLRYILTHYNGITHALNWLHPASFTSGINSFYGIPWEILRTNKILGGPDRAVTFVTKSGGLPAYRTIIILVPEYELGITILTAGDETFLEQIREIVTVPVIQAADKIAKRQVQDAYTGTFGAENINSSITLSYTEKQGLEISRWISNGTDVLGAIPIQFQMGTANFHLQVVPTLLFRDPANLNGELWRTAVTPERPEPKHAAVWDDLCLSDLDTMMYAGKPLNEIAFWDRDHRGKYGKVELTAFRVSMTRQAHEDLLADKLVMQDL
ncbi:uncharacterized protein Z518_05901 [Rhinocladiella mackenziei CBS 650.93]|uniref:Beta-lactamase-related domain-containing protein n=1 Tax=Rhinocladiella mackenziei CBS 650.93 TaxID=1442369 RepID=A0A0D2IH01_9EURO|nr:uncharacterized protein Z518_05901 [Rhinocladiella mackenziei CBS 650.93]KIX05029.1 hypothetical protein Z518_05901 [Rhinocladiella mackenziei CBS 650.93]